MFYWTYNGVLLDLYWTYVKGNLSLQTMNNEPNRWHLGKKKRKYYSAFIY